MGNAACPYRFRNFRFYISTLYKQNSVNTNGFRFFRNRAETTLNLFCLFKVHTVTVTPSIVVVYNHLFTNYNYGKKVYSSNSDLLTTRTAMDVYLPYLAFNFSVSLVAYNKVPFMAFKQQLDAEAALYLPNNKI